MTKLEQLIDSLKSMEIKGGTNIGIVTAEIVKEWLHENWRDKKESFESFLNFIRDLRELKPSMATVHNITERVRNLIERNKLERGKLLNEVEAFIANYVQTVQNGMEEVASIASNIIKDGDVILTHSFTFMVFKGIERAWNSKKKFEVICTESRPLCEGVLLADKIAQLGVKTSLITDAAVAYYLPRCTKVFIGADAVYTDGSIVNKIGSLSVGILADFYQKPLYVIATTSKFFASSKVGTYLELERRPSKEVLENPAVPHLQVENIFFEVVPSKLIDYIITEKGIYKPCQVIQVIEEWEGL